MARASELPVPVPAQPISIRVATENDVPFIDALQKAHTKMVGWMPMQQLQNYVAKKYVLIAEGVHHGEHRGHGENDGLTTGPGDSTPNSPSVNSVTSVVNSPLGYCISRDQYFKRDDCGIIYQLNIAPGKRRGLVGATLLREVFNRAAYGCKLFCCWCAQDIEANYFWEAMGFIPLAFRTGSRGKQRIHIFWQRRIRQGDMETPYWFPSQTTGGAIREDRLVLPIPPGTHWKDAKPLVLPGAEDASEAEEMPALPPKRRTSRRRSAGSMPAVMPVSRDMSGGGLYMAPPEPPKPEKPQRAARPKPVKKNNEKYVAAARELRDRYMEQINAAGPGSAFELPPSAFGKYEVSRTLEASPMLMRQALPDSQHLLDAA